MDKLWEEYRDIPIREDISSQGSPQQQEPKKVVASSLLDHLASGVYVHPDDEETELAMGRDEYFEWCKLREKGDWKVENPIAYWINKREHFPRLSQMALDIHSIPAMSDEPERIFSKSGHMVSPRRAHLDPKTIGAAMAVSSWEREGVISLI